MTALEAGLKMMLLPAARAGAIFQEPITKGKFQALMRATTPTGSWMVKECILPKPSFTS